MDTAIFHLLEILLTALIAVGTSSGFWIYKQRKLEVNDCNRQLLIGLAHDRIVYLCMKYIQRGKITQDEYENLHQYLWLPYSKLGGNGTVVRLMKEIDNLKITKNPNYCSEPDEKESTKYEDVFKR